MKKYGTIVLLSLCIGSFALADVFASRTRITNPDGTPFDGNVKDGTGVKLWYYLNDTATAVSVKVINTVSGAVAATINAADQGRSTNPNSVVWDGAGAVDGAKYYFSISATGPVYSETDYKAFYFQPTSPVGDIATGIFTRGVDANNDMNSRNFGYWYASNSDGGSSGYLTGLLRYNPDGSFAGTNPNHPILVNTLGTSNSGTFNWGSTAPWTSALDGKGRIYQVSNGGNFVTRVDHDTAAPKVIVRNVVSPRGLYAVGEGANLKLYIAADTVVWRANIGNDDTLTTPLELVASLGTYVRDVLIDDGGGLLVTLRTGTAGTAPGYIEKYDISTGLPKKRADALFQIVSATGQMVCMAKNSGPDKNSAADDTIFYSVRGATSSDNTTFGVHRLIDIAGGFPDTKQIFRSGDVAGSLGGNNNANADLALDWAGNIVWFENSNEEIFMVSPPRSGTSVTRTTRAYDTVAVAGTSSAGDVPLNPSDFALRQNYPNPFNPSTAIAYQLPAGAQVTVAVYDVLGTLVKELYNGRADAGQNAVVWNATNRAGANVSSGVYLYRVTARTDDGRSFSETKRMMLLK